jgi:AP-1 complex subunit gamma-1
MNSSNMYTVGIALGTFGNIASAEMSRDLAPEIDRLLGSSNPHIKKKAALCAVKIVKKVPDLYELFIAKSKSIMNEKNHAVLLTGATLLCHLCETSPNAIQELMPNLPVVLKVLKSLTLVGSSPEHDVHGINDPFLQIRILNLLRIFGRGNKEASEAMSDTLAQIATNTDASKNVGNAILYETCLTIMDIEADSGLRVLAINILGKFVANPDNNIRYVSLNSLTKAVTVDLNAVQRHRETVLECLRDPDISIRRRALEVSFHLINESNVRIMMRELLTFLETADQEFKVSMPQKLCQAADSYAPNKRWHIDTIIRVLKIAGNYVKEDVLSNFIKLVASASDLIAYAVFKLFYSVKTDMSQDALVISALWCIGEYGDLLFTSQGPFEQDEYDPSGVIPSEVSETEVINTVVAILEGHCDTSVILEYGLMCLLKLSSKSSQSGEKIKQIISQYTNDLDIEIQQRSAEFLELLRPDLNSLRSAVLERMPVPKFQVAQKKVVKKETSEPKKTNTEMDILSDMFGTTNVQSTQSPKRASSKDDIMNLFDSHVPAAVPANRANIFTSSQNQSSGNFDLLSGFSQPNSVSPPTQAPSNFNNIMGNAFSMGSGGMGQMPGMHPSGTGDILSQPMFGTNKQTPVQAGMSARPGNALDSLGVFSSNSQMRSPPRLEGKVIYNKNNLQILLEAQFTHMANVKAVFKLANSGPSITNLNVQIAVPKTLKLQLFPISGTVVSGDAPVIQNFQVSGGTEGSTKLRFKIGYVCGSGAVEEIVDSAI